MDNKETALSTGSEIVKDAAKKTLNLMPKIFGMIFPYAGIEETAKELYISEIQKSDMSPESQKKIEEKVAAVLNTKPTVQRLKNQIEIANIAAEYAKEGTKLDTSSGVNQEWLERYMDSAKFVSDEEMQLIWGKILAKEFEEPGSTPPNMSRILAEITPKYAQIFRKICCMNFVWLAVVGDENFNYKYYRIIDQILIPISENTEELLHIYGFSVLELNELETLGLIKIDIDRGYSASFISERDLTKMKIRLLTYINGNTKEISSLPRGGRLPIGNVMLTEVGQCLRRITQSYVIPEYEAMIDKYMAEMGVIYKKSTAFCVEDYDEENGTFEVKQLPLE